MHKLLNFVRGFGLTIAQAFDTIAALGEVARRVDERRSGNALPGYPFICIWIRKHGEQRNHGAAIGG